MHPGYGGIEKEFSSVDEANEFLDKLLKETDGMLPLPTPETPKEVALDMVYRALESKGKRRTKLAKNALEIDPDCADAYALIAEETAESLEEAIFLYKKAVEAAERTLGPEYFTDSELVGHFWGLLETRPYMRAAAALGDILWSRGEHQEAIDLYCKLLRLNPNDNQGLRHCLVA